MQTRYHFLLRIILVISDLLLINLGFILVAVGFGRLEEPVPGVTLFESISTCNLLWICSSNLFGMYREKVIEHAESIYRATWRSVFLHAALFVFYMAFGKSTDVEASRQFLIVFYLFVCTAFVISRFAGTLIETTLIRHFKIRKEVAILGLNGTSRKLAAYFRNNSNNFLFQGFLKESDAVFVDETGAMLPAACEQIRNAAVAGVKEIYVTMTPQRMVEAPNLIMEAERQCIRLKFIPDITATLPSSFTVNYMGEFPVINLRREPLEEMSNRFKKRIFDIIVSALAIVLVLSWLIPVFALIIRLGSRGPIFFSQMRSGRDNKPFSCLKFRSMYMNDGTDLAKQATRNDERITPFGRFMRRTSLDELPQFINVLLGSMSIVGPRPHPIKLNEEYVDVINSYMLRHFLKPGITGWAQVNGYRGETREQHKMEARIEHDIWYMENWSTMLDVRIVVLTVINMIKGEENAY